MIISGIDQGLLFVTYYAAIGNYSAENQLYNNLSNYPYCDSFMYGNYESANTDPPSGKIFRIDLAHVNEFEFQGKYHIKRCFLSLGYEHLTIGTPTYDFISMGGGIYL